MTEVTAEVQTITPETAAEMLEQNTHNRSVAFSRVDQYAADMAAGQWKLNGESIKIADDGRILDGQHRLQAIVAAGLAVEMLVIDGLEHSTQETMDQGRGRTLADIYKLRGEKYANQLATVSRVLCVYEQHGTVFAPAWSPSPTASQASAALGRNPDLRESVAHAAARSRPWLVGSYMGALHYLWATVDPTAADDFLERLYTGAELAVDDPIFVLRERLRDAHVHKETISLKVKVALVIKAWNHYLAGDSITSITYRPGGAQREAFPTIDGLIAKPGRAAA